MSPTTDAIRNTPSRDEPVSRAWKWILLAGFFLCLLPVIASPAKYHGDERFYTDAALAMTQTGDYWTPRYPDGSIRLLKPILTYWAAAGSFELLGVSLFAARLLFALAGTAAVAMTYRLARTIFKSEQIALLSALVLASNIQFLTVSGRVTPDILLCVFVLMSMWGFARIWFEGDEGLAAPLLAWIGMGLAVQTKGLLGLCPLAANALFWMLIRPREVNFRQLFRWQAVVPAIAVAAFWYAVMLHRHGLGAMRDFYSDQVGARVSTSAGFVLGNLGAYLFAGFRHFLPWTLVAVVAAIWARTDLLAFWKRWRAQIVFLFVLFALLVVIFGLGNIRRTRYLTASYPMLAVLLAGAIATVAASPASRKWFSHGAKFIAVILAVGGIALAVVGISSDARLAFAGAVFAGLGLAGAWPRREATDDFPAIWLAGAVVIGMTIFGGWIRPVFAPVALDQVKTTLLAAGETNPVINTWQVPPAEAGKLRMITHGQIPIRTLGTNDAGPDFSAPVVLTVSTNHLLFQAAGYRVTKLEAVNPALRDSWIGRKAGKPRGKRESDFWIATKPR